MFALSIWEWCAVIFCGLCVGMAKTGINGLGTLVVPVLVIVFGAKPSTGILLPMLCVADLIAVAYYRRSAEWKYIIRLLPWALAGFAVALLTERQIPDKGFKTLIGVCILAGLLVMLWSEYCGKNGKSASVPSGWQFSALFGVAGGFSTMIGNAAGPIMSVFLLSVRLPKNAFVGTAAWFFMIVNFLKLPLQYFVWNNISGDTLLFDLALLPAILIGAWIGIVFVKKVSEKNYRRNDDVRMFIITVHAIKGALMNIGEEKLSSDALKLEQAGREGNIELMITETPVFLDALRIVIDKMKQKKDELGGEITQEEVSENAREYLREKLLVIQAACGKYNNKAAEDALAELKAKPWPQKTQKLLDIIAEHLLHSDFEEAAKTAGDFLADSETYPLNG